MTSYASDAVSAQSPDRKAEPHVCPVWVGYFLANPLRRLFESPTKLLRDHVSEGMTVLEVGCAMGFFSLPLARMVGPQGRVLCVDVQERMIEALRRRAARAGLLERIQTTVCGPTSLGLDAHRELVDFAAAIHVVHEVPDPSSLFEQIYALLKRGGRLLIVEPRGHVSPEAFARTLASARQAGFVECTERLARRRGARSALLEKPLGS